MTRTTQNGSQNEPTILSALIDLSREYGANREFVIAGGGNTSVKNAEHLWVKGSGTTLADITGDGFVKMNRSALDGILGTPFPTERTAREAKFKAAVMAARVHPEKEQRPSVEALLHHLMPRKYVVHTHPTLINMFTCCEEGEAEIRGTLGKDALWIADVDPGLILARTLSDALEAYRRETGKDTPRAILLQNHGLVVGGDTVEEVKQNTDWIISALRARLEKITPAPESGAADASAEPAGDPWINTIAPALRMLLADNGQPRLVRVNQSAEVMTFVRSPRGRAMADAGPLTPDQIVYCRSFPLWVECPEPDAAPQRVVETLRQAVTGYKQRYSAPPQVVLVAGLGLFAVGGDIAGLESAMHVYVDAIKIMLGASRIGRIRCLSGEQRDFIETWEAESYRRKISSAHARKGRVAGKIAMVTGGAQGFGFEIVERLAREGALVAVTDLNADGARKAAAELNARFGAGSAVGIRIDVADGKSTQESMNEVVRTFGGLDILIANAGVLKAASVTVQSEQDFDFVTSVNYRGYFIGVQKAAPIMSAQHWADPDYWADIIQINSKSGLEGSSRNGAYAGSKFGGIGLTQSFALELVANGIKVNAICPGNFFDGPLWSDPDKGLFVQYLRAHKVPGAKTLDDVRAFYTSKVPMGRGCTGEDVMKAVYYIVEQKYETGQAIPVTGGQVMLH